MKTIVPAAREGDRIVGSRPAIIERRYVGPFLLIACLFMSWAFAASLNDVLIRHFRRALDLTRAQSSLIQLAFYIGYFCAAIPAGLVIRRYGYKACMLTGLALYAAGAFLFYPAAQVREYAVFLGALYMIAFGLAFLETSANPYVAILGDPSTGSARLNLAQSVYGIGAILGPIIGGLFIFAGTERSPTDLKRMPPAALDAYRAAEAATVQMPYAVLGCIICLLALAVALTRFPDMRLDKTSPAASRARTGSLLQILKLPRPRWAIVAQFFYVGAQVGIWSFFIDFTEDVMPTMPDRQVAFLLSGSLGMLVIGRFTGAFIQRRIAPRKLLVLYATINVALCLIAASAGGIVAVAALWSTSFFMSIIYPTIFALGVEGLGEDTEMASSLLVMSIIGGALIPPGMGLAADALGGVPHTMIVPALCFAICLLFAIKLPAAGARA